MRWLPSGMSELVPAEAVALLYRRYLKGAARVPNGTIRILLTQQIRSGFRRNRSIKSALAQRELIKQAHADLHILEDERHSRTLYINKFGVVSCLEWEVRRTEWHLSPRSLRSVQVLCFVTMLIAYRLLTASQMIDEACPDISETVELMAAKLEVDDTADLWGRREEDIKRHIGSVDRMRTLEGRILTNFQEAPQSYQTTPLPTLKNPTGSHRPKAHWKPDPDQPFGPDDDGEGADAPAPAAQ